ncbi:MAG: FeoB-associated Cys-rich membrane protein [Lachnospiraceae bacterium]|nr:FeoB-associated Cys-rich membrane protein [Lachnospiraceae bacterium]
MINIIISAILVAVVGTASFYIWKEKKKGNKCIGCPYSGSASCHCKQSAMNRIKKLRLKEQKQL